MQSILVMFFNVFILSLIVAEAQFVHGNYRQYRIVSRMNAAITPPDGS